MDLTHVVKESLSKRSALSESRGDDYWVADKKGNAVSEALDAKRAKMLVEAVNMVLVHLDNKKVNDELNKISPLTIKEVGISEAVSVDHGMDDVAEDLQSLLSKLKKGKFKGEKKIKSAIMHIEAAVKELDDFALNY